MRVGIRFAAPVVLLLLVAACAAPVTVGDAASGVRQCGEVQLTPANPDLAPRADGTVRMSGAVLVDVRLEGARAADVARVTFALGAVLPDDAHVCEDPVRVTALEAPVGGEDADAGGGFFVPVNTTRVVDGAYAGVLRAFDADDVELGRATMTVDVENGRTTPADAATSDRTIPWPRILPGDGTPAREGDGLTVVFAEPVAAVEVAVNGRVVPVTAFTPPRADGLPAEVPEATPLTGYRANVTPAASDVVRVVAHDHAGNRAEKVVRAAGAAPGEGLPGEPDIVLDAVDADVAVPRGGTAVFDAAVRNAAAGTARVALDLVAPERFNASVAPAVVSVGAGEAANVTVTVHVPADTPAGVYTVILVADDDPDGDESSRSLDLRVHVTSQTVDDVEPPEGAPSEPRGGDDGRADEVARNAGASDTEPAGGKRRWLPAPAWGLALVAIAVAAFAGRR